MSKHSVLAEEIAQDIVKSGYLAKFGFTEDGIAVLIDQKLSGVREAFLAVVRDTNIEQIRPIWESLKLED
jgi:hypothetical protein